MQIRSNVVLELLSIDFQLETKARDWNAVKNRLNFTMCNDRRVRCCFQTLSEPISTEKVLF